MPGWAQDPDWTARTEANTIDDDWSRIADYFTGNAVDGDTLTMRWAITYTRAGCPDLTISGTETAVFEGDRIARLRDDFDPGVQAAMGAWMAEHGAKL